MRIIIINIFGAKYEEKIGQPRLEEASRYSIGDYSVEGHEDSVAVERKEGRE
jgi:hypothetical protein